MYFLTKTEAFLKHNLGEKPSIRLTEESSNTAVHHVCALVYNSDVALHHILRRGLLTHKVKLDKLTFWGYYYS